MKKITLFFKSRSKSNMTYKTERHRDGKITCFCPGFVYTGKCWHVTRVKQIAEKV